MRAGDVMRTGLVGLRTRPLRTVLASAGVAIGIAAMVAVLGVSESSRAALLAQLDRLGTNLLTVTPGQTLLGENAKLPEKAKEMIERIGPVERVASVRSLDATVRRTDYVPEVETGGISVLAADSSLLDTLGGTMREGRFLDAATGRYPAVVLGAEAAEYLGIEDLSGEVRVWIEGRWYTVIGIMDPQPLAPELDRSALVGYPTAQRYLDGDRSASTIYVRANPDALDDVAGVLGATANPQNPEEVQVDRPSEVLEARAAAKSAFTSLFLGLGAVALLVGGIGIANVTVISVLERRSEIGLRRALGATRRHIRLQFLTEAVLVAGAGGVAGAGLGAAITVAYASLRDWQVAIPPVALAGAAITAIAVGAVAGLYPAMRAARLAPTEALRTT